MGCDRAAALQQIACLKEIAFQETSHPVRCRGASAEHQVCTSELKTTCSASKGEGEFLPTGHVQVLID